MRRVHLVDAEPELGGHLHWVTTLPGSAPGRRVDAVPPDPDRQAQERRVHPQDAARADDVLEYGAEIVIVATGSRWAGTASTGRPTTRSTAPTPRPAHVSTPEQLVLEGKDAGDRVVVYDTDGYYMGATIAELGSRRGSKGHLRHALRLDGPYMRFTLEEQRQYQRLVELGVEIVTQTVRAGGQNPVPPRCCTFGQAQRALSRPTASCSSPSATRVVSSTTS